MAIVAKNATFDSMTVPMEGAYSSRFVNGMAVLVPDMSKNVAAVAEFLNLPTADEMCIRDSPGACQGPAASRG